MKAALSMFMSALPYLIVCAVIGFVLWFAYSEGRESQADVHSSAIARLKAGHEAELLRISAAQARLKGESEARERVKERDHQLAMSALDSKYQKELSDAQSISNGTIDGLRAGAIRLRRDIRDANARAAAGYGGPGGDVRQAGAGTGVGDGGAIGGFGTEDAAAVIGAADTGDRWAIQLRACQAIVRSDRAEGLTQ